MVSQSARFFLVAVAATGLVALTGCNPAPKYARPPAQAPLSYKEAVPKEYKEGDGWKIARPGDDRMRGKWWEIYNDPKLSALEEQVAVSNQSIALAEANVTQYTGSGWNC